MVRMKLTARKHVRVPRRRNVVRTESHSDGQNDGYFLRTLWTPLFIRTSRLPRGNSYLWRECVVIYERPMTDRICRIHQLVETRALRWTFEAGMREAAHDALAVLQHEAV
jgi:hypothetical protein